MEESGQGEGSSREEGGVKDQAMSGSGIGDGIHDTEKKRQRARWMWWRMSSNSGGMVGDTREEESVEGGSE